MGKETVSITVNFSPQSSHGRIFNIAAHFEKHLRHGGHNSGPIFAEGT